MSGYFLSAMARQATNIKGCDFSFHSRSQLALSARTLGLRSRSKQLSTSPHPHCALIYRHTLSRSQRPVCILELYVFRYFRIIPSDVLHVIHILPVLFSCCLLSFLVASDCLADRPSSRVSSQTSADLTRHSSPMYRRPF